MDTFVSHNIPIYENRRICDWEDNFAYIPNEMQLHAV
jgi:hypothetical protein